MMKDCCTNGESVKLPLGYCSPQAAMQGPKEKILYVLCPTGDLNREDYLATVDADPSSATYSQVIHRLPMPYKGDEIHHSGWNACSSCYGDGSKNRRFLIIPSLVSSRIYVCDVLNNATSPVIHKIIEPEELISKLDISFPHTSHCLPSGEVMISCMGDGSENAKGNFVLVDSETWKVKGTWVPKEKSLPFGYDFWYQPRHDVMISTEFGAPKSFTKGFDPADVGKGNYGRSLNIWKWSSRELIKTLNLGDEGLIPLEIRFLHNPDEPHAYVGCALSSTVFHIFKSQEGEWEAEKVVSVASKTVENWALPSMPGLVTDIIISLDDRFLFVSNWFHGDVRQYDITNRSRPVMVGQVFIGGLVCKGSPVKVVKDEELQDRPEALVLKGKKVEGGAQMLQLSLDGTRLYVTNSLYSRWDKQFYPEMLKNGSSMVLVNVKEDGLSIDNEFHVDFGKEPGGPVLAHETRYPGGDCTSDIWI